MPNNPKAGYLCLFYKVAKLKALGLRSLRDRKVFKVCPRKKKTSPSPVACSFKVFKIVLEKLNRGILYIYFCILKTFFFYTLKRLRHERSQPSQQLFIKRNSHGSGCKNSTNKEATPNLEVKNTPPHPQVLESTRPHNRPGFQKSRKFRKPGDQRVPARPGGGPFLGANTPSYPWSAHRPRTQLTVPGSLTHTHIDTHTNTHTHLLARPGHARP